jgi:cytochrome c biogenesis factor
MSSMSSVVIVVLAVVLVVVAALMVRSRNAHPWPAIVVVMLTSAVCFTVGSGSGTESAGPSIATVVGSVVGLLSMAAAITALVPGSGEGPPSRVPIFLAAAGMVLGALGLVLNQMVG